MSFLLHTLIQNTPTFVLHDLTEDGRDALDLALDASNSHSPSYIDCIQLLLDSGHPVSARHLDSARESKNPLVYNLLQTRQAKNNTWQPPISYITRDILTKGAPEKALGAPKEIFESASCVESNQRE